MRRYAGFLNGERRISYLTSTTEFVPATKHKIPCKYNKVFLSVRNQLEIQNFSGDHVGATDAR